MSNDNFKQEAARHLTNLRKNCYDDGATMNVVRRLIDEAPKHNLRLEDIGTTLAELMIIHRRAALRLHAGILVTMSDVS